MNDRQPTRLQRLIKVIQANTTQLRFGNYSAQLSFYVIFTLVPLMLALANVISLLPFSPDKIMAIIDQAVPSQVGDVMTPVLQEYLTHTSSGVFSLGVLISLWPASKVFATLELVINEIHQVKPRTSFVARLFAYILTLGLLIVSVALSFVVLFGQSLVNWLEDLLQIQWTLVESIISQSGLIGYLFVFCVILFIYYVVPNVRRPFKYSLPGALIATIGFGLVSNLFQLYLLLTNRDSVSNAALGVFIVLIIWLYLNGIVLCVGAYANVLYYDYAHKDYYTLVAQTDEVPNYHTSSPGYDRYRYLQPHLSHQIIKKSSWTQTKGEDIEL